MTMNNKRARSPATPEKPEMGLPGNLQLLWLLRFPRRPWGRMLAGMSAFLAIVVIHFLGLMSPGPDFALISRNSLCLSRRSGMLTALGLGLGILVHCTYSLLGIGLLISQSILLYNTIKWIGALYLMYIGFKALTHKAAAAKQAAVEMKARRDISPLAALRQGFLCNVLNPKVTLFFLALFTQVIDPSTPLLVQIGYGLWMSFATFAWFAFVASVLSMSVIRAKFERIQGAFERVMGALLIALGLKIALSHR